VSPYESTPIYILKLSSQHLETLIVWTEPDGVDYALSFQDPEGCSEVWNFIQEVQQHLRNTGVYRPAPLPPPNQPPCADAEISLATSSPVLGAIEAEEPSITASTVIRSGHLPQPALGIIPGIERAIRALARTIAVKERICEYIQREVRSWFCLR
jgi:protein phosphatase 4 regulatory subunit 3